MPGGMQGFFDPRAMMMQGGMMPGMVGQPSKEQQEKMMQALMQQKPPGTFIAGQFPQGEMGGNGMVLSN